MTMTLFVDAMLSPVWGLRLWTLRHWSNFVVYSGSCRELNPGR